MTKILVIGGGVAGTTFIMRATKMDWDITLVDPKEFFEVPFASLRGLMDPDGFGRRTRKGCGDLLGVTHIQAKVGKLHSDKAILDNGTEVPFDYAVVATGSAIRGFDGLKINTTQSLAERESQWRLENGHSGGPSSLLTPRLNRVT